MQRFIQRSRYSPSITEFHFALLCYYLVTTKHCDSSITEKLWYVSAFETCTQNYVLLQHLHKLHPSINSVYAWSRDKCVQQLTFPWAGATFSPSARFCCTSWNCSPARPCRWRVNPWLAKMCGCERETECVLSYGVMESAGSGLSMCVSALAVLRLRAHGPSWRLPAPQSIRQIVRVCVCGERERV